MPILLRRVSHRKSSGLSVFVLCSLTLPAIALGQARSGSSQPGIYSAGAMQDSLVALARRQIGRPYVLGGAAPETGFDCSGLIQYLLRAVRTDIARNSKGQAQAGEPVRRDVKKLRVGDLLTFGYASKVSHVGIYTGGGKFIHASTGTRSVVESLLERRPSGRIKPWIGARRIKFALATPAPPGTRDTRLQLP